MAEQNLGQFAGYLRMKVDGFVPYQFNEVKMCIRDSFLKCFLALTLPLLLLLLD